MFDRKIRSLMSRMTDDSARIFLSNMIKEGSLNKEDREDLKKLIDELEKAEREAPEGK
jgi:predicted transcriptional regulator